MLTEFAPDGSGDGTGSSQNTAENIRTSLKFHEEQAKLHQEKARALKRRLSLVVQLAMPMSAEI
jgi:hypothetical protein